MTRRIYVCLSTMTLLLCTGESSFATDGKDEAVWEAWKGGNVEQTARLAVNVQDDAQRLDLLFRCAFVSGEYEQALEHFGRIPPSYPGHGALLGPVIDCLLHLGRFDDAYEFAKRHRAGPIDALKMRTDRPLDASLDRVSVVPFADHKLTPFFPAFRVELEGEPIVAHVDTGGSFIAMHPDHAKELGIKLIDYGSGNHGHRTVKLSFGIAREFKLGDAVLKNVPVITSTTHTGVVFGMSVLAQFFSTLDYPRNRLILSPRGNDALRRDHMAMLPSKRVEHPFHMWGDHYMFARGFIGDDDRVTFFMDSGLVALRKINQDPTIQAGFASSRERYLKWGYSEEQVKQHFFKSNLPFGLGPLRQEGTWCLTGPTGEHHGRIVHGGVEFHGCLGHAFVKKYAWTLDFKNRNYLFSLDNDAVSQVSRPAQRDHDDQETTSGQNGSDERSLEQVKATLSREIARIRNATGIPSISIALLKGDRIVWSGAFGHSNVQLKVPASPDTIYSTGSCFKPITAMAVMQLVDAGKLNLDDPINTYLGEHAIQDRTADSKPVTVRHLLAHYSGLTTRPEAERGGLGADVSPLWSRASTRPLTELPSLLTATNDPGQAFRYSNYGYSLAGLIVEKVSGLTFGDYVADHILRPLGIKEHAVVPTPEMVERLALPYRLEHNRPVPEHWHRLDVYPAGDTWLSVPAMSTVLLTHLNDGQHNGVRILSEESVAEMRRPQCGGTTGLDFGIREHDGSTLISHGGGVTGYTTKFLLDVDSRVGVYVATNATLQLVTTRLLAQMAIDLMRDNGLGKGLVREVSTVGVMLAKNTSGQWRIDGVIPGSSANREGLQRGLVVRTVNDVAITEKSLRECLQLMNRPPRVRLEVIDSMENARTVELTKQKLLVPG